MTPTPPAPGPSAAVGELLLAHLDYYRAAVAVKVAGLSPHDLRSSLLPSGWTPLQLVKHLAYMERRWLIWGFLGVAVEDPWADQRDGQWRVDPGEELVDLLDLLTRIGDHTRRIVAEVPLATPAVTGGRFPRGSAAPSLVSILLHVLHEYARHCGHLDIACELIDGRVGE